MKKVVYTTRSEVWLYPGMSGWHFVSLSHADSLRIKNDFGSVARGWGSLPVSVKVGESTWETSIFPDKKEGVYILPLKASVRKREGIQAGDSVRLVVTLPPNKKNCIEVVDLVQFLYSVYRPAYRPMWV